MWAEFLRELRWSLRRARRNPTRALPRLIVAAGAIAAATAGFSVTYALLWRPLPFRESAQLVVVKEPLTVTRRLTTADLDVERARLDASPLVAMQAHLASTRSSADERSGAPETSITQYRVSPEFFPTLGTPPFAGRLLNSQDAAAAPLSAVLAYELWRSRYGGDLSVLDRVVSIGAQRFRVVGVMPPLFAFPAGANLWTPLVWSYSRPPGFEPWLVRLRSGVSVGVFEQAFPRLDIAPIGDVIRPTQRLPLMLVVLGAALVAMIAVIQAALLQIGIAAASLKETRIALALGASQRRVLLAPITDAAVFAIASVGVGWLLVPVATRWMEQRLPSEVLRGQYVGTDWMAFAFSCVVACLVILATTALAHLLLRRVSPVSVIAGGSVTQRFNRRMGTRLVTAQVLGTTALLYLTGLAVLSVQRIAHADLGMDAEHILAIDVPGLSSLPIGPERSQRLEQARQTLSLIPGVTRTARALQVPLSGRAPLRGTARLLGETNGAAASVRVNYVTRDFLDVLGASMVTGDRFRETTDANVVIVNRSLAALLAPAGPIVGRTLQVTANRALVIGVMRDTVDVAPDVAADPQAYFLDTDQIGLASTLIARVAGDPAAMVPAVRAAMTPQSGASARIDLLRDDALAATSAYRGRSALLVWMALTGILLASVGIGGSLMLMVAQQTREIGLRIALGAERPDIRAWVLRQAMAQLALGLAGGLVIAMIAARFVRGVWFDVSPADPTTVLGVAVVMGVVSMVAAIAPAERAVRIDPAAVLKES